MTINKEKEMPPTTIHLIRHGEVHNPQKILYGRLSRFRLSAKGLWQAGQTGRYLRHEPIAAVFASPLLRARQTAAEILAFHPGIKLRTTQQINEVHTFYEGRPAHQVDRKRGDIYTNAPEGYEQPVDVFRRTHGFLNRLRQRFPGEPTVAVSHGDVITFTVLWAKGWEVIPPNKTRLHQAGYGAGYPAHASVTSLTFHTSEEDERPEVKYVQPWQIPPSGG